jgi:hypothetical protein
MKITRRKTEINDSINDSFLSRLWLKLTKNDSNSDMAKAKLPLPFDVVPQKNGGTGRRLIYN